MLKRTALKPGKPLARTTGFKSRQAPLRHQSPAAARQAAAQKRAYAGAPDARQCFCSVCGQTGETEHSHHFSQHLYPQHANDERNWLVMGKWCGCHRQYENNRAAFAAAHPALWRRILADMEAISPKDFAAYRLNTPF